MSVFQMAQKYYPRLWGKSRLDTLAEAGRLTPEEMKAVINSDAVFPSTQTDK